MSETLDCREAIARLQDYLKQELTPELAGELRAHLEHCRPCEGTPASSRAFSRCSRLGLATAVSRGASRASAPRAAHRDGAGLTPVAVPLAVLAAGAVALLAWSVRSLTTGGAVAAWLVGIAVLVGTGWAGGAVLAAFFVSSSGIGRLAPVPSEPRPEGRAPRPMAGRGQWRPRGVRGAARAPRSLARTLGRHREPGRGRGRYLGHRGRRTGAARRHGGCSWAPSWREE